jgi:hypothetical protein
MSDDGKADRPPLTQDRDGPLAEQGWHGGATFFSESGGRPAQAAGQEQEGSRGAGSVPEDAAGGDVHRPASEADSAPLQDEHHGETQSWPGSSFGSIPPPG